MSVLPLHLPTYSKNRHFSFFSPYMSQDAPKFLPIVGLFLSFLPNLLDFSFLIFLNFSTQSVSLTVSSQFFFNVSLKLPKITTFTLSSGQDIIPWSKSSTVKDTCLFKVCWEKKKKKYQHFNIFDYTYLPKTDICLFFLLLFSMNLSLIEKFKKVW